MNQGILFEDEVRQPMHPVKQNKTQELARAWMKYANTNKIKPNTKAYRWAQHAFLCGIGAVMGEETPPIISICMACGRDVASIIERTQPR